MISDAQPENKLDVGYKNENRACPVWGMRDENK